MRNYIFLALSISLISCASLFDTSQGVVKGNYEIIDVRSAKEVKSNVSILSGTVIEAYLNQPSHNLPITIKDNNIGVQADENGRFKLELPPGDYKVVFGWENHSLTTKKIHLKAGEETELKVVMGYSWIE